MALRFMNGRWALVNGSVCVRGLVTLMSLAHDPVALKLEVPLRSVYISRYIYMVEYSIYNINIIYTHDNSIYICRKSPEYII